MTYYHRCRPFKRRRGKVGPSKLISGERFALLKWSVFCAKKRHTKLVTCCGNFLFFWVCFNENIVMFLQTGSSFWKPSSFNWLDSTHIFTYLLASPYYFYSCFCVGVNWGYLCNYEHFIMSPYCYCIGSTVTCLLQFVIVLLSSVPWHFLHFLEKSWGRIAAAMQKLIGIL